MRWLFRLERRFGRCAIPQLTTILIAVQVATFVVLQMSQARPDVALESYLTLVPRLVLAGEVWRLATFLILPPLGNPICAFFFWYLFYLMGTALEQRWGDFRYNAYLLSGYVATVAASFVALDAPSSNAFLQGSVFLAFAFLYPHFELYLFFVLPVKIKWLAALAWAGYAFTFVIGDLESRALVGASVFNFFLFFGRDVWERMRIGGRRMSTQAARFGERERPYIHRCETCGITDRSHPQMEFRYCGKCAGTRGYCSEHLRDHEHVVRPADDLGAAR